MTVLIPMSIKFNDCLRMIVNGHFDQVMRLMDEIDTMQDVPPLDRHVRKQSLFWEAMRELQCLGFKTAENHHCQNCKDGLRAPITPEPGRVTTPKVNGSPEWLKRAAVKGGIPKILHTVAEPNMEKK